jgi:L-ascorbate metabolism protein UlaG (beta-lactamase superfamily)
LDPKIVIPMHYSIPGIAVQLAQVDTFLQLLGGSEVQSQPRLSVTASNLPPNMRVTVLTPQARTA